MSKVQNGSWKTNDGVFKVFIRGGELENGSLVEVISRFGNVCHITVTGIHSKLSGGFLYDFKYTSKPDPTLKSCSSKELAINRTEIAPEVTVEELEVALGLD